MRQLVTKTENGYTVSGAEYAPEITGHRIAVKIENTTFAELDLRTAVPQTLDTDNAGFNSRRDTMHRLLTQPYTGVPDLYSLEPTAACPFDEADIDAVRLLREEYGARMDALHGKDILE